MSAPIQLTVTIEDDKGKTSKHQIYLTYDEPTTKIDTLYTFAQEYAETLSACIKGRIAGLSWSFGVPLPLTIPTAAGWDSDVEEKLAVKFRTLDRTYSKTTIPTFKYMDSGVPVDDNSAGFDAYVYLLDLITTPSTTTNAYLLYGSNSRGVGTLTVVDEREIFVK
jgi:hypothetical protein